jgi:hypothetical protein
MRPALWGAGVVLLVLFSAASCDDPDPPREAVPATTVTATATATATADPVVRVRSTVPDDCKLAAADARAIEDATFAYEKAMGGLSEVHSLTATGIFARDQQRLNEAIRKFDRLRANTTDELQVLLTELEDIRTHNKMCREDLDR